jgi:hypothetical protein
LLGYAVARTAMHAASSNDWRSHEFYAKHRSEEIECYK